jgi:nitrite reductase/ring-hydroxylating ferredoxin subunit
LGWVCCSLTLSEQTTTQQPACQAHSTSQVASVSLHRRSMATDEQRVQVAVCYAAAMRPGELREVTLWQGKRALLVRRPLSSAHAHSHALTHTSSDASDTVSAEDFFALSSTCTHYGAPLRLGALGSSPSAPSPSAASTSAARDDACAGAAASRTAAGGSDDGALRVRCPWHGACFRLDTGDIEEFPDCGSLHRFQVGELGSVILTVLVADSRRRVVWSESSPDSIAMRNAMDTVPFRSLTAVCIANSPCSTFRCTWTKMHKW